MPSHAPKTKSNRCADMTIDAFRKHLPVFDEKAKSCAWAWRQDDEETRPQIGLKPSMKDGRKAPNPKRESNFNHLETAWESLVKLYTDLGENRTEAMATAYEQRKEDFNLYRSTLKVLYDNLPETMKLSESELEAKRLRDCLDELLTKNDASATCDDYDMHVQCLNEVKTLCVASTTHNKISDEKLFSGIRIIVSKVTLYFEAKNASAFDGYESHDRISIYYSGVLSQKTLSSIIYGASAASIALSPTGATPSQSLPQPPPQPAPPREARTMDSSSVLHGSPPACAAVPSLQAAIDDATWRSVPPQPPNYESIVSSEMNKHPALAGLMNKYRYMMETSSKVYNDAHSNVTKHLAADRQSIPGEWPPHVSTPTPATNPT